MEEDENLKRLLDRNEIRRLQKAARDKDLRKLAEWGIQFEDSIRREFQRAFDKRIKEELEISIENFIVAIIYTLHFNEKCKFGGKRIDDFMDDLLATIDNFTDGSYSPDEYKKILKEDGIIVKTKNNKEVK